MPVFKPVCISSLNFFFCAKLLLTNLNQQSEQEFLKCSTKNEYMENAIKINF